jgi:hypothetical protein
MNSQPQDPWQQPPYVGWQEPQNAWQQPSYGASPQPPRRAGLGLGCAIVAIFAVVALIVIGGVMWGGVALYHAYKHHSTNTHATNTHTRSATSSATKPTLQLQTVAGLNGLLTDVRNHFGDTVGYDLMVYPDHAGITRADPSNNRHNQTFDNFDGNWRLVDGSDSPPGGEFVTDLSKFDVAAVIAKLPGAAQALGMTDVKETTLMIRGLADLGSEGFSTTTGTLTPQIWVYDILHGAGYMDLNPDGSVKALHPPS